MAIVRGDNDFTVACIRAAGLDPSEVRRIIIDMGVDAPMMIYVEMYGTDRFYKISPPDLTSAKIEILSAEKKQPESSIFNTLPKAEGE